MKKINWFDKHSHASMTLFNIVTELETLAKAFKMTGNEDMYTTLMAIAEELEGATKEIRNAMGDAIAEQIDRAGKSTETVLKAALAGALLAGKNR